MFIKVGHSTDDNGIDMIITDVGELHQATRPTGSVLSANPHNPNPNPRPTRPTQ